MESLLLAAALFVVGSAIGAFISWKIAQSRGQPVDLDARAREAALMAKLEDAQEDERAAKAEIDRLRGIADRDARLLSAAQARVDELAPLKDEVARIQGDFSSIRAENAQLREQVKAEKDKAEQRIADLNTAEKKLADVFDALSAKTLSATTEQFLKLAATRFETEQEKSKAELEKREQAVAELVKPINEGLQKIGVNLGQIEEGRTKDSSALLEKLQNLTAVSEKLRAEAITLSQVLRNPAQRGKWGEISLRRAFEDAGLTRHLDFAEQQSITADDNVLRPDAIVSLPGGRKLVIDSKVPADAYFKAHEAVDLAQRDALLREHAQKVRGHIKVLAARQYGAKIEGAPGFTLMFLPNEGFLAAAIEADPSIVEDASNQMVALVTPRVLMPMLWIVEYAWRQSALAQNAREIATLGTELYERISKVAEYVSKIGSALNSAVGAYNDSVGSLQKRLLPTAKKFKDLRVLPSGTEEIELNTVDSSAQGITKPELLSPPEPAKH
jgi:DNA recombination protein RmuC